MTRSQGEATPPYDAVRAVFDDTIDELGCGGGALCVYVDGVKVVDVWAGDAAKGVPWSRDTMATLMSATKGLTALCAQILYDRGLLDVDAPIATYWPEFAQAGKEHALVRHVLDHTVGVVGFPDPGRLLDWDGRGWDDYDAIADRLAAAPPAWEPGTRIGYHAISCGWLTGELVRRITGTTIGAFLRDEVAVPLDADVWIGTPPEQQARLADVIRESYDGLPPEAVELDRMSRRLFNEPGTVAARAAIHMHGRCVVDDLESFMNLPRVRAAEIAAANGSATARALARVYAMLSMGGELDGVRIVSPESVRTFGAVSARGRSALVPEMRLASGQVVPPPFTCYGLGYACNVPAPGQAPAFGPTEATFGHAGHGGQIGFCDPVHRIAVGYIRNHLTVWPLQAVRLIDALYRCAGVTA